MKSCMGLFSSGEFCELIHAYIIDRVRDYLNPTKTTLVISLVLPKHPLLWYLIPKTTSLRKFDPISYPQSGYWPDPSLLNCPCHLTAIHTR